MTIRPEAWRRGARVAVVSFDVSDGLVEAEFLRTELVAQAGRTGFYSLPRPPPVTPAAAQQFLDQSFWLLTGWLSSHGFVLVSPAAVAAAEGRLLPADLAASKLALDRMDCGSFPKSHSIVGPVELGLTPELARRLAAATGADLVIGVHATSTTRCFGDGGDNGEGVTQRLFVEAFDRSGQSVWRDEENLPVGLMGPPDYRLFVISTLRHLLSAAAKALAG